MGIEVELRGFLTNKEKKRVLQELCTILGPPDIADEAVVFFEGSSDVKAKISKWGVYFSLKEELPESKSKSLREEYTIKISLEDIEDLLLLLDKLGYGIGYFSTYTKYEFSKGKLRFIIKTGLPVGDFFEIKTETESEKEVKRKLRELQEFLKNLKLKWFDERESEKFFRQCSEIVEKIKIVKDGQINRKLLSIIEKYKGLSERKKEN